MPSHSSTSDIHSSLLISINSRSKRIKVRNFQRLSEIQKSNPIRKLSQYFIPMLFQHSKTFMNRWNIKSTNVLRRALSSREKSEFLFRFEKNIPGPSQNFQTKATLKKKFSFEISNFKFIAVPLWIGDAHVSLEWPRSRRKVKSFDKRFAKIHRFRLVRRLDQLRLFPTLESTARQSVAFGRAL